MKSEHGGDLWKYEDNMRSAVLDFSANISPLGMPEGVRQAVIHSLEQADIYPDPFCRKLRANLSERLGVPAEWIVCGNGAADLIYRICAAVAQRKRRDPFHSGIAGKKTAGDHIQASEHARAAGRALVTAPSFSEYANALILHGFTVDHFLLRPDNGFILTEDILHAITPGTDLVFLGQPNNPAGRTIPRELLLKILDRCTWCGALLALDECFAEFLDEPEAFSLLPLLREGGHPPLVLLRSFTKLYGMAGLRLGYAICANQMLAEEIYTAGAPWSVSSAAQAAGLAALQEEEYVERLRRIIREERHRLAAGLAGCGLKVIPGEANYLLFYTADTELGAALAHRDILLRDCRNYRGLGPGWFRTAVRTAEENHRLLQELIRGEK